MDAPAVVQHLAVCPVIFHQTFFIIEVAAHSLEISCWQQSQNGCLKVSILGIVAAPGHIVGACPDTLQVWRSFAAGGKDLMPSSVQSACRNTFHEIFLTKEKQDDQRQYG